MAKQTDSDTQTQTQTQTDPSFNDAPVDFSSQTIDFSGVSTDYTPAPKGVYVAQCTGAEVRTGQQSGAPYINIEWTIQSVPDPDTMAEYVGRKVWNSASLLPQALWRIKGDMIKMGVDPVKLEGKMTIDDICFELQTREAELSLDVEEYTANTGEKKKRNKVVAVNPLGSAAVGYASTARAF